MNCFSCHIRVYHLWFVCALPGVFLSPRVTGVCPVTTDWNMRVYVRTTTNNITKRCNGLEDESSMSLSLLLIAISSSPRLCSGRTSHLPRSQTFSGGVQQR